MRLSDAMMLGSTTCKMIPGDLNSCAVGAALNAVGVPQSTCPLRTDRVEKMKRLWTWLSAKAYFDIALKFDGSVCSGEMTFEQLVDYVRSIEPEEVETEPTQEPVQLELPFPAEVAQ